MKKSPLRILLLFAVFSFTHCRQETLFQGQTQLLGQHRLEPGVTGDQGDSRSRAVHTVSASNDVALEVRDPRDSSAGPRISSALFLYCNDWLFGRQIYLKVNLKADSYRTDHIDYWVDRCSGRKKLQGRFKVGGYVYTPSMCERKILGFYGNYKTYMRDYGCSTGENPARVTIIAVDAKGNNSKPVVVYMTRGCLYEER